MACLSCQDERVTEFLDLGESPLANGLIDDPTSQTADSAPLRVGICEGCGLVQLTHVVCRQSLFSDYPYFSSVSDTVVDNAAEAVEAVMGRWSIGEERYAVEIASNDGYLLQHYRRAGVSVLGIEPAANIARHARDQGIPTLVRFFDRRTGIALRHRGVRADVVHAHNVLAHVDDLSGFVEGMRHLLKDDGVAIVEVPYVRDLVDNVEFDTIYHEHLAYFSVSALQPLFERAGMRLAEVDRIPIHGGSLRIRATVGAGDPGPTAAALIAEERELGLDRLEGYTRFADRVRDLCTELRTLLQDLQSKGQRIAAYGASAKGTTLLHAAGIGDDLLQYVVDKAPAKQGRFTPGTHLPIHRPQHLLADRPDAVLLLSWNHKDEILEQQRAFRAQGGQFVVPVPSPHLV